MSVKNHELMGPAGRQLCWVFNGIVIGSVATLVATQQGDLHRKDIPADIDIIIPLDQWPQACRLIPEKARANRFGGFKFSDGGKSTDVWPEDALRAAIAAGCEYLWVPRTSHIIHLHAVKSYSVKQTPIYREDEGSPTCTHQNPSYPRRIRCSQRY